MISESFCASTYELIYICCIETTVAMLEDLETYRRINHYHIGNLNGRKPSIARFSSSTTTLLNTLTSLHSVDIFYVKETQGTVKQRKYGC